MNQFFLEIGGILFNIPACAIVDPLVSNIVLKFIVWFNGSVTAIISLVLSVSFGNGRGSRELIPVVIDSLDLDEQHEQWNFETPFSRNVSSIDYEIPRNTFPRVHVNQNIHFIVVLQNFTFVIIRYGHWIFKLKSKLSSSSIFPMFIEYLVYSRSY